MLRTARSALACAVLACAVLACAVLACAVLAAAAGPPVAAATLTLSCGGGVQADTCRDAAQRWARQQGHQVRFVDLPNSSTERLALIQQMLAGHSARIDVYPLDIVWPGQLASELIDLRPYLRPADIEGFAQADLRSDTVDGRLVALPYFADVPLLYYRKDLLDAFGLPVPRSWDELGRVAAEAQRRARAAGQPRIWGYVWQGAAYEGLSCNALEWIASAGGGTLVDARSGRVTVDNPRARAALDMARGWIGTISPLDVLNMHEEQARAAFQSGHAVFMRNWPYARALLEHPRSPVRGRVGVAPLPAGAGGNTAATLGGWQFAVSRHSRHPREATALIAYLTAPQQQRTDALQAGLLPTRTALYDDAELRASLPDFAVLTQALRAAVERPSSVTRARYARVSAAFSDAVHDIVSGRSATGPTLRRLQRRLQHMAPDGAWN